MMTNNANDIDRNDDLNHHWMAEQCPIVDGIIFPDGRVRKMRVDWIEADNGRLQLAIETLEWTTLKKLASDEKLQWTGVIELCSETDSGQNLQVLAGEGGLGSDGFVAALNADKRDIRWIAFFNSSNPFEDVRIDGDRILARTNLDTWWSFPIQAPELVSLT